MPLRNDRGHFFETESLNGPQFQSAVREIPPLAYHAILAAAGVTQHDLDTIPTSDAIAASPYPLPLIAAPTDTLRIIAEIPAGAGYVPRGDGSTLNIYEAAALQERARQDHQEALRTVQRAVHRVDGTTFYNNNIDLFARIGEQKFLIEAKSINAPRVVVDRMRYGLGQLADYAFRYGNLAGDAERVLVFASPPPRDIAWIASVVENERVSFIAAKDNRIVPLNDRAANLPFIER